MLIGRRQIFINDEIEESNVLDVLNRALQIHVRNLFDEEYLYWYRRGVQPILERKKEVRPDICNKIVVNNADQVVTFKNGYFMTEPSSYSAMKEETSEKVREFNEICRLGGKSLADNEIVDWFHTVGLGVCYVCPDKTDEKPLNIYSLDPRRAFVGYSLNPGNEPVMGVNMVIDGNTAYYDVFTKYFVYKIEGNVKGRIVTDETFTTTAQRIVSVEANILGEIPIIEFQYDKNRMGAFEVAIPIMDEINNIESNRADSVEQMVQQLCVAYNCNFEEGVTANSIRQAGMICLRSIGDNKADFKILESNLSQSETQTTLDALYNQLLDKTGLPSVERRGSGDNGSAVYLRSGYAIADTNRRNTEDYWRRSDERFRRVCLALLKKKGFNLSINDMELNIEPPSMSNLLVKTQSAMNMRELGLAPEIWLERSGLSNDPLADIERSKEYIYKYYENKKEGEALADPQQLEEVESVLTD